MTRKNIATLIVLVVVAAFLFIEGSIAKALLDYGYGLGELPKASLVYFHISKGSTVKTSSDGKTSIFIGTSKNKYGEYFADKSYKKIYEYGGTVYYGREDGKDDRDSDFGLKATDKSCVWFTIYEISADYPIESFK